MSMAILIAIPIFSVLIILQTALVSRIHLLQGTADLVLLTVIAWALQKRVQTAWHWGIIAGLLISFVSGLPFFIHLITYLAAVGIALLLRQRVWQVPILAMFVTIVLSTLLMHALSLIGLRINGAPIPVFQAFNTITLPSLLLNILVGIPIYALLTELANVLYPEEIEV